MKKKLFLKFFLFTVLATMVTFTSCKNYDDDIDNLQGQIKDLVSQSDMKTQLATLQSALAAAQTDASKAMTEVEKLAGLEKKVTDMMAELETTNAANFEAQKEELNTLMATLKAEVEDALGLMLGMVFDVELITDAVKPVLTFSSAIEQENIFQTGMTNPITFVKGNQVQTGTSFVIRVSPSNVVVTPEMVSLQNSMGAVYENAKVTKVEPEEVLITRAANGGGYWRVHVELEKYDKKAFEAATKKGTKEVLFAAAVNNGGAEASSKVLTSYVIGMKHADYTPASKLWYFVGDKNVTSIKNRYNIKDDLTWIGTTPDTAIKTSPVNTEADATDDKRSAKAVYPAVQGEPIKIALTKASDDAEVNAPTNIKGMYVTLDKDRANESDPSELNAWNGYTYSGLNTVVTGTEISITIDDKNAIDDEIGFRVFAVNHDGTLVDPDGKAFYVSLGKPATDWTALNTIITATEEGTKATDATSAKVDATLTELTGATTFEWTTDKSTAFGTYPEYTPAFYAYFEDDSGAPLFNTKSGSGSVTGVDFSEVAKVYTKPRVISWLAYKDDHVYNGKLTIKNATGHVLATLDVTFKKELPTAVKGFSVKDKQIVDGVLKAYMLPTAWDATTTGIADKGTLNLYEIFNYPNDNAANFETTFATSTNNKKDPLTVVGAALKPNDLTVENSYIDNTTEHATKVEYNYGKISTETMNEGGTAVVDYKVTIEEFNTVYSNIYNSYNWEWATREQLISLGGVYKSHFGAKTGTDYTNPMPTNEVTYGGNTDFALTWIYGVSSYDGEYNRSFGLPYNFTGGNKMYKITNVKLVSNTSDAEDYFTSSFDAATGIVALTKKEGGANNPTSNVPSTLKVEGTDMYGKAIKFETPVIVKPRTTP